MTKKVFTIISLLVVITGSTWVFLQFKNLDNRIPDPIETIPDNATTVIKLNTTDWNTFYIQSKALINLLGNEHQSLNHFVDNLDSLRSQKEGIQSLLENGKKYLTFFEDEPVKKNWLFTMGLPEKLDDEYFRNLFFEIEFKDKRIGDKIIHLHRKLNWTIDNQTLLASPNEQLLEKIIRRSKEDKSILADTLFAQSYRTQDDYNLHLTTRKTTDNFKLITNNHKRWTAYETRVKDGKLNFFGYAFYPNHTAEPKDKPNATSPWKIIPTENLTIESIQTENIHTKLTGIVQNLSQSGKLEQYTNQLTAIENNCNCNPKILAFNRTENYGIFNNDNRRFAFIHYPNFNEALTEYSPLISEKMDKTEGISIYRLKYTNLYSTLLDQPEFDGIKYLVFKDDYLVFSASIENIHWLIRQWKNNRILAGNTGLSDYLSKFQKNANWFYYEDRAKHKSMAYPFDITNPALVWKKDFEPTGVYNHLEIPTPVVIPERKKLITTTTDTAKNRNVQKSDAQYTFQLNANAATEPAIVTNHYTKEKEIFIQDENHTVYLINNKGKELWSKNIGEKIQSPVRQIDIYRNGKLQLVFSTENKIHCLDRNGKDVEGFPVQLASKATSPLAVFDYDKKRKYRLVIGCKDRKIYNYTVEGKPTKGWKQPLHKSPVIALEHIRIKSKDYLFALHENNEISLLKRTGSTKYNTPAIAEEYNRQGYALDIASSIKKTRILFINNRGELIGLPFEKNSGEILKKGLDSKSKLTYRDANGDKKTDLVIGSGSTLKIYSSTLEELLNKNIEEEIRFAPRVYRLNSQDIRIGINTANNHFYLLDIDGKVLPEFPRQATFPAQIVDLNKDGKKEHVIADKNVLKIF